MKKYCYILLLFGVLLQNPKIVLCGNTWLMLEKSGTSHFTKFNLTYLQRLSRLSPEVQTYIAKFTDPIDGKGTLVKFLDDCDDVFRKARAAGLAAEKAIRTELADPNSPAYKALKWLTAKWMKVSFGPINSRSIYLLT